jgi:hypothetical protein
MLMMIMMTMINTKGYDEAQQITKNASVKNLIQDGNSADFCQRHHMVTGRKT